jgi:hypothetical protein
MVKTIDNVQVPFFAEVKNGIPHSGEIEIEGTVLPGGDQAIWFEFRAHDGIPFHLNIRMGYNKEHTTVLNSYERGRWKREERHGNNVTPGAPITLNVSNHFSKWQITINGQKFTFGHRLNSKDIRRLEIRGAIQINRMTLKNLENNIEMYQSNQPAPQPAFNPSPYQPSSSPPAVYEPMLAGSGPTIQSGHPEQNNPGYGQPYPPQPNFYQPTPNEQPNFYQPTPNDQQNSMYPNLSYGQPGQNSNPRGY